ncbi:MAG: CARDB domain-containing protein, partial [bacterium]
ILKRNPYVGEEFYLDTSFKNIGSGKTMAPFSIAVYVDGVYNSGYDVTASWDASAGTVSRLSIKINSAGKHKIEVTADSNNSINEIREDNNSLMKGIVIDGIRRVCTDADIKSGACKSPDVNGPDLIVADINFNQFIKNEQGTLSVTIKNLGEDLISSAGLTNVYNNFSDQNFIFAEETPNILAFKTDRDLPTIGNPLKRDEKITLNWKGKFNTSGNLYLHFTVDNANELAESNENNNTFTKIIQVKNNANDKIVAVPAKDSQSVEIDYKAKLLSDNKLDNILDELRQLRNKVKEQDDKIKYLKVLTHGVKKLSEAVSSAINNFITYGVDENTKKLGEGERAAVMNSYKTAFNKLPETEDELSDAIKIANGRWPSITNDAAEKKAKEQFQKIYKRIPDMNNDKDNAAVTIMAYGLRQQAKNRNLESEKKGIQIFKSIFRKIPQTTEDWNTMQAITYSGAKR